jgi:hypothetical protein
VVCACSSFCLLSGVGLPDRALWLNSILNQFHLNVILWSASRSKWPFSERFHLFNNLPPEYKSTRHSRAEQQLHSDLFTYECVQFPYTIPAILQINSPSREHTSPWGRWCLFWSVPWPLSREFCVLSGQESPSAVLCSLPEAYCFPHICFPQRYLPCANFSDVTKRWAMTLLPKLYPRSIVSACVNWQEVRC